MYRYLSLMVTSTCGFAAICTSFVIVKKPVDYLLAGMVALAALLDYHLQWSGFKDLKTAWQHVLKEQKLWILFVLLLGLLFLYHLRSVQLLFLFHLATIALLYGFGIKIFRFHLPPLRNINYLKIFLIVYVWVATTVWLPFIDTEIDHTLLWVESFQRGLFYLALTLPFDIRDEQTDKNQQLKTLANRLGVLRTKVLSVLCLLLSLTIASFYYPSTIFLAIVGSHLMCCMLILFVHKTRPILYYTGLMDGTIIFQYLLLLLLQE